MQQAAGGGNAGRCRHAAGDVPTAAGTGRERSRATIIAAMPGTRFDQRRRLEAMTSEQRTAHQLDRLNRMLAQLLPCSAFYARKLASVQLPLARLDDLAAFPFTEKDELIGDASDPYAANRTFDLDRYVRLHRTSGTRGQPLAVLDTDEDWQWWIDCWQYVLDAARVEASDRVLLAFSFGPFIGFWSAYDAAAERGCLVIPSGGLGTLARLEIIRSYQPTAVFCTPTYALHMAEIAAERSIDLRDTTVRTIVVAGEPGGSIPAVRARIETAWDARVVDHSGASEVGAWGYADRDDRGLHVNEAEFVAEFLSLNTGQPASEGELSELVLTSLGRLGSPVIRYRTGDLVRPVWSHAGDNRFVLLDGGVLGRGDDMMIIRGVNIFPSSLEQILRSFPEIVEYRLTALRAGQMDALRVEIEDQLQRPERVADELQLRLGLKVDVQCVPLGSLPRFEAKGKRFVDRRKEEG